MVKKGRAQLHAEGLGHTIKYVDKSDAYFCVECDAWLEIKCSDPSCRFCKGRDEKLYKHLQQ